MNQQQKDEMQSRFKNLINDSNLKQDHKQLLLYMIGEDIDKMKFAYPVDGYIHKLLEELCETGLIVRVEKEPGVYIFSIDFETKLSKFSMNRKDENMPIDKREIAIDRFFKHRDEILSKIDLTQEQKEMLIFMLLGDKKFHINFNDEFDDWMGEYFLRNKKNLDTLKEKGYLVTLLDKPETYIISSNFEQILFKKSTP